MGYEIGHNIQMARENAGFTQEQAAEKLNEYAAANNLSLKKAAFSRLDFKQWENGEKDVKAETILALSAIFDTDCHKLLTGIDRGDINVANELGLKQKVLNALRKNTDGWPDILNFFMTNEDLSLLLRRLYRFYMTDYKLIDSDIEDFTEYLESYLFVYDKMGRQDVPVVEQFLDTEKDIPSEVKNALAGYIIGHEELYTILEEAKRLKKPIDARSARNAELHNLARMIEDCHTKMRGRV